MAKIKTVKKYDFASGELKAIEKTGLQKDIEVIVKVLGATAPALILVLPKSAFACIGGGAFGNVHEVIMRGFDAGVVLIIIFGGAAWALGHRSKAIELLIGVSCGYLLARHACDIRDFLKGI